MGVIVREPLSVVWLRNNIQSSIEAGNTKIRRKPKMKRAGSRCPHIPMLFLYFLLFSRKEKERKEKKRKEKKNLHRTWVKLRRKISGSLKRSIFYRRCDCLIVLSLSPGLVCGHPTSVWSTNKLTKQMFFVFCYLGRWQSAMNTPRRGIHIYIPSLSASHTHKLD